MDDEVRATVDAANHAFGDQLTLVKNLCNSDRSIVLRLSRPDGTTLIAKRHFHDEAHQRELVAFSSVPQRLRPKLIAASNEILLMEDLGDGPSLADLLLGNDPIAAEAALLAWASSLGQVAGATIGATSDPSIALSDSFIDLAALDYIGDQWDLPVHSGVRDELEDAVTRIGKASELTSLVVFDACPDNNRISSDGTVRIFDFEGSGWAHPAFDASYCLAPFCTCWCLARLPPVMHNKMFDAYCCELPSEHHDDGFYELAVLAGALLILLGMRHSSRLLDKQPSGASWASIPLQPAQHLLLRAEWLAGQREYLPTVATFADLLVDEINARFSTIFVPSYPAFQR